MTLVELNIGLDHPKGRRGYLCWTGRLRLALSAVFTSRTMHSASVRFLPRDFTGEPTLVVAALVADAQITQFRQEVFDLATTLEQDCIAVLTGGKGSLVGTNAGKWEPFDPTLFIKLENA